MNIDDPRVRSEVVHGQTVYFPSSEAWAEILQSNAFADLPLSVPEHCAFWLREYGQFKVAHLGLVRNRWRDNWQSLSLLKVDGYYYRVHYENVICNHCKNRCWPSATPSTVEYAGSSIEHEKVWAEFDRLPLQRCPHCHEVLRHRQTVWLACTDAA